MPTGLADPSIRRHDADTFAAQPAADRRGDASASAF
jgi:hypothetical protein